MGESGRIWRAALWMAGALSALSLMAVAGREAGRVLSTADLLVWRSVIGCGVVCMIVGLSPQGYGQLRSGLLHMHLLRNLLHFTGQFCWFTAVLMIPLAQLFALEFTSPVWVLLLAPLFLAERFSLKRSVAGLLGFLGVLTVVRPFGVDAGLALDSGQVWALAAAIGFAGNMLVTKRLSADETSLCIIFYMTLMQAPMGIVASGGLPALPPDGLIWLWVLALALCGLVAHFCMAEAFRQADAAIVAPMDFARLPLIAVVGVIFYAEPFDPFVLLGGGLIFIGNYLNIRTTTRFTRSR